MALVADTAADKASRRTKAITFLSEYGAIASIAGIPIALVLGLLLDNPLPAIALMLSVCVLVLLGMLAYIMPIALAPDRLASRLLFQYSSLLEHMGASTAHAYSLQAKPSSLAEVVPTKIFENMQVGLRDVLGNFKRILWCVLGDGVVVVSVKVRYENQGGDGCFTVCRNPEARVDRPEGLRHTFGLLKGNTEFASTLGDGHKPEPHFISHNLIIEADAHRYHNTDRDWRYKYVTIATVPIKSGECLDGRILGWLCVDSKIPGIFKQEEELLLSILKQQAALILPIFYVAYHQWEAINAARGARVHLT